MGGRNKRETERRGGEGRERDKGGGYMGVRKRGVYSRGEYMGVDMGVRRGYGCEARRGYGCEEEARRGEARYG